MHFLFHIVSNNGHGLSATRIPKSVEIAGKKDSDRNINDINDLTKL
jgi:hypothetical protein